MNYSNSFKHAKKHGHNLKFEDNKRFDKTDHRQTAKCSSNPVTCTFIKKGYEKKLGHSMQDDAFGFPIMNPGIPIQISYPANIILHPQTRLQPREAVPAFNPFQGIKYLPSISLKSSWRNISTVPKKKWANNMPKSYEDFREFKVPVDGGVIEKRGDSFGKFFLEAMVGNVL